ncbi:O-methyltransferase [Aspergillus steynii IBT 23096]|uniref:catechol O-methyltransferase n=1 Tax=Aspergillus steynii IBT 23096 TaxID=1392250 RepID=A0A2I2GAA5_9EURO|nr:O-methyltransferase [Aspergillus steynii IBT 23096]PLB49806.1 O-methyltransferase [Aspergillus steynii IBT 23096]
MSFYKQEEEIYHNDGREPALLAFIESHPDYDQMKGSPQRILAAIDQYGREKDFLMNVGQHKGDVVRKRIAEHKPTVMIELGGYVGYSAILFGNALKQAGGRKYISLEISPVFASVSASLVKLAGLDDVVEIKIGPCRDTLRALGKLYGEHGLDMIFFDHAKTAYVNDLKLCEELGLVARNTVVLADNVICPGNPAYLEYVRATPSKKQEKRQCEGLAGNNDHSVGNPLLVYDTCIVHGLEPTGQPDGVEISRCLGVEA